MICNICGKDQPGNAVEIVTGKMLNYNETGAGSNKVKTSTYGEFQKVDVWFCRECWLIRKRKADKKRLTGSAIMVGLGILGLILMIGNFNATCLGLSIILGFIGVLRGLKPFKRFQTKYAQVDMELEKQTDLFRIFVDRLDALVDKARKNVFYWQATEWQEWMEKKGSAPHAYHSAPTNPL